MFCGSHRYAVAAKETRLYATVDYDQTKLSSFKHCTIYEPAGTFNVANDSIDTWTGVAGVQEDKTAFILRRTI